MAGLQPLPGTGEGNYPLPLVLVEDVVRAFLLAMDAPGVEGHNVNMVGDVRPSSAEMIRPYPGRSRRDFRLHTQNLYRAYAVDMVKWVAKRAGRKVRSAAGVAQL